VIEDEQLALDLAPAESEAEPPPHDFWGRQDARINELLRRYAIPFEEPKPSAKTKHVA
jgi:hypothetical protein